MHRCLLLLGILLSARSVAARTDALPAPAALSAAPAAFTLHCTPARQRLLVTGHYGNDGDADLTAQATFESLQPHIAAVDARGIVTARGDGAATIVAHYAGRAANVQVIVRRTQDVRPTDFRTDVIAALSHAGCNQGACHGSPQGKNGFRLSLRGFDSDLDYFTLTREVQGRRTDSTAPADSLILRKGAGRVAHGGGVVLRPDDPSFRTLLAWVAEGRRDSDNPRRLTRLEVLPAGRRLHSAAPRQQLVVRAWFRETGWRAVGRDEQAHDVTDLAVFSVNGAAPARVSPDGLATFAQTGEASILVRYLDQIVSARLTYVRRDPAFVFVAPPPANAVDELVFSKQRTMQLAPAPLSSDEVFLRRVCLDVTGALPTPEEARAFLDSKDADRRAKLIDRLLASDGYAQFWALKWADIMRGSPTTISERGVHSFHRYLVRTVTEDRPLDGFARELLTGLGNTLHKPAANFYRVSRTPEEIAETFAQLFLGVRVQCAKCHNHPFESITQADYYGLAAYFAQVQRKGARFMLDDEVIYLAPGGQVQHPVTRRPQEPAAFGAPAGRFDPDDDRRVRLADWLTRPDNRFFAPSLVNRLWFHLLGRGIVDPVDDFRDTNPPSNPELLKALADQFVRDGYRAKPILRTILNSRTYQLAADAPAPSPHAAPPDRYFTRAAVRMLSAEQVLDAVAQATGVPEPFKGFPLGTKAVELPEGGVNHPFLQAFSKPVRDASCECAREEDPSLPQMLHLLNNAGLVDKIKSPKSRLARWLAEGKNTAELIEQVYLATLSRRPMAKETALIVRHIDALGTDRAKGLQDLQFALINSAEFLLRH